MHGGHRRLAVVVLAIGVSEPVRPIGLVEIKGLRMHAIYVPPDTNDGSMFMHHVVLVWSEAGHTYGVGFHNTHGIAETLRLNKELARHIRLVGP